jgi:hypothetical protein
MIENEGIAKQISDLMVEFGARLNELPRQAWLLGCETT